MTREEYLHAADSLAGFVARRAMLTAHYALLGDIEQFASALQNPANRRNRQRCANAGICVYSLREARSKFSELKKRAEAI